METAMNYLPVFGLGVFVSFGPVYRLHDEFFIVGTNAGI